MLQIFVKPSRWRWFKNIEKAEPEKAEQGHGPTPWQKSNGYQVTDQFIYDDTAIIRNTVNLSGGVGYPEAEEKQRRKGYEKKPPGPGAGQEENGDSGEGPDRSRGKGCVTEPGIAGKEKNQFLQLALQTELAVGGCRDHAVDLR